jgi:hypothetical protein
LPHVKGLLVPFPMDTFLTQHPNASAIVTDIYGDKHDIFKDKISVIFTKSQFKLHDYYSNWKEYQDLFEKHNCEAAKLNEEDTSGEATLTYQMLQTLVDVEQKELEQIAAATTKDIENLGRDKETMLRVMGAYKENERKNYFQEALMLYPELLNDNHTKQTIKSKKDSLVKDAKSGKLRIEGAKYTFLIPDLYAFAQKIFGLEVTGLLDDGEVYCRLYDEGDISILRSPHLYREWGLKKNIKNTEIKKWFITDGIYISSRDNISKLIQADWDGDKTLCLQYSEVIEVAKRNMKGIVPLYYEMAKAKADTINNENLYNSLLESYKANVGIVSNQITKCWNSEDINEEVLTVIRWLCMESNFQIDRAKTNFMTTRPGHVDEIIKKYTNTKVPYFFKYAKSHKYGDDKHGKVVRDSDGEKVKVNGKLIKVNEKVEAINSSTMNRLEGIIYKANKRIHFAKVVGKFDYKQLQKNNRTTIDDEAALEVIAKYEELNENKKSMMNEKAKDEHESGEHLPVYKKIRKELLKTNKDAHYIADVLVKYLYAEKNSEFKTTIWCSFGKEIVRNIKKNVHNIVECKSCRVIIDDPKKNQVRCEECSKERRKEKDRFRKYEGKISALKTSA